LSIYDNILYYNMLLYIYIYMYHKNIVLNFYVVIGNYYDKENLTISIIFIEILLSIYNFLYMIEIVKYIYE